MILERRLDTSDGVCHLRRLGAQSSPNKTMPPDRHTIAREARDDEIPTRINPIRVEPQPPAHLASSGQAVIRGGQPARTEDLRLIRLHLQPQSGLHPHSKLLDTIKHHQRRPNGVDIIRASPGSAPSSLQLGVKRHQVRLQRHRKHSR